MTNTYRAVTETGEAMFEPGVFERDFSAVDEQDVLAAGHIELVPRAYKVLSDNCSLAAQGMEISAAFVVEIEHALIQGGHLERVAPKVDVPPVKGGKK